MSGSVEATGSEETSDVSLRESLAMLFDKLLNGHRRSSAYRRDESVHAREDTVVMIDRDFVKMGEKVSAARCSRFVGIAVHPCGGVLGRAFRTATQDLGKLIDIDLLIDDLAVQYAPDPLGDFGMRQFDSAEPRISFALMGFGILEHGDDHAGLVLRANGRVATAGAEGCEHLSLPNHARGIKQQPG